MKTTLRHNKNSSEADGMTLIEVLLYVSVAAMVLTTISVFYAQILQSRVKNSATLTVQQQGMLTAQKITQEIRNANGINNPSAGNSDSRLSLSVRGDNFPVVIELTDGVIEISRGGNPAVALTSQRVTVTDLTFRNLSRADTPGVIRVTFTLAHINPNNQSEREVVRTFQASAALRH